MDYAVKFLLIFILLTPITSATDMGQLQSNTIFNFSAISVNITVLAPQNFSQIQFLASPPNTLEFTINGSTIQFNSTADKTISGINYSGDVWQWSTSTNGFINVTTNSQYNFANYSLYKNTTLISTNLSDSTGNITFNTSSSVGANFSVRRASGIALISPANQSTQTITYLPYSQSFTWSNEGSNQYNIQIAKDSGFSIIVSDLNVLSNQTSIGMWEVAQFFWRVRTYDGVSTYGLWSRPFNVELTQSSLPSSDGSTGVQGIVYEIKPTGNNVLVGARVTLSNLTHFFETTSDTNGYFVFKNLANNSDYLLQGTKKNYDDSMIIAVQTVNGTWKIQNIYMFACTSSYTCNVNQQFTKFTVQTLFGTKYPNVEATVYLESETTALYTETTDAIGIVNFWLIKDQKYRLTFINATSGINREITIVASDTEYLIIISGTGTAWQKYPTQRKDAVYTNVTKAEINSTHAYINTSYLDLLNETTALIIYINQTNASDPYNQTIIQSWTASGAMNDTNHSFIVTPFSGQQYLIHYYFTHTTYGTNSYISVSFTKSLIPSGISSRLLLWFSIIFMVMTGAVFTASTAELGLIVVAVEGWIFLAFGFLKDLNTAQVEIGLTLATVLGVIAYIVMKNKKEGYS